MKHFYKKHSLIWVSLLSLIIFSCSDDEELGPPPVVEFSADRTVVEVNQQIQFRNNSSIPSGNSSSLTFFWDFGDGLQSNQPSPTKSYSQTGTYDVVLTVTSEDGQSISDSLSILVGDKYLTEIQFILLEDEFFTIDSLTNDTIPIGWDVDGSSADLVWSIINDDGAIGTFNFTQTSIQITGSPVNNVPLGSTIPFEITGDFRLDGGVVELFVLDDDRDENGEFPAELMLNFGFDLSGIPTEDFAFNPNDFDFTSLQGQAGTDPNTGEGVFFFVDQGFPVVLTFLFFEIR